MPISKFLIDDLCRFRKTDWVPRFYKRVLKIPQWTAEKDGDYISFTFRFKSIISDSYMHLNDSIERFYTAFDKTADSPLLLNPTNTIIIIDGVLYQNLEFYPEIDKTYDVRIHYEEGDKVEFLCKYGLDCFMYDIKMNSELDVRHYPCLISSHAQPTTTVILDIIGGKNGEILERTTSQTKELWTNEVSTDGELLGFPEDATWALFQKQQL